MLVETLEENQFTLSFSKKVDKSEIRSSEFATHSWGKDLIFLPSVVSNRKLKKSIEALTSSKHLTRLLRNN